ncbi:uncharacterized protein EV420DRAFT_1764514 [Desarmillaria tabescens]|uniref:Uncharacterized protein n=1 Tax=Armillaria tabescens TaxID=1929756 RepID=A0AA39N5H9_ARMTA|nr:uncharacterized protein EV420DRAFT_1764514 [Desarmillaria tabescens]KAK0458015.1 hypothetical protein EV420DRAFT_1764514 [Desarmillaria tabescens]
MVGFTPFGIPPRLSIQWMGKTGAAPADVMPDNAYSRYTVSTIQDHLIDSLSQPDLLTVPSQFAFIDAVKDITEHHSFTHAWPMTFSVVVEAGMALLQVAKSVTNLGDRHNTLDAFNSALASTFHSARPPPISVQACTCPLYPSAPCSMLVHSNSGAFLSGLHLWYRGRSRKPNDEPKPPGDDVLKVVVLNQRWRTHTDGLRIQTNNATCHASTLRSGVIQSSPVSSSSRTPTVFD